MTVRFSPIGNAFQFLNTNGRPLSLGNVYTYAAGTSTPAATYTDNTGGTPNANPIPLDSSGRPPGEIWLTEGSTYKFIIKDSGGSIVGTFDNIPAINDQSGLVTSSALASNTPTTGATLVGYRSTASGASGTTVQARLQGTIVLESDFGAAGDGVTNDTGAFQAAVNAAAGGLLRLTPGKTYLVSGVNVPANTTIDLTGATVKQAVLGNNVGTPVFTVQGTGCVFIGGGSGTINGQRGSQPANGFSDSFNSGANGTGRAFRAAIMADQVTYASIASLVVRGVVFTQQYGACVACRDVPYVTVEDCYAHDSNFELAWSGRSAATLVNISYQRNICYNLASGDPTVNADNLYCARYQRVVIAGNRISNGERCMAKIESPTVVAVTGNVFDTNSTANYPALQIDGTNTAAYVTVTGNSFYNCQAGISLSSGTYNGVLIAANTIFNTTGSATADAIIVATNGASTGFVVSNNNFWNIKRHGINMTGQWSGITVANNEFSGQATAGSFGMVLSATTASWTDMTVRGNVFRNFEASNAGGGVVNFNRSAAFIFANFIFQGNVILAGGAANRGLRSPGVDLLSNGIISDNYIDGQMELYSASIEHRNNTVTGTVTLPAGTANDDAIGATQTTIGANGAASALTANPVGYLKKKVSGTTVIVPYYNP